MSVESDTEDAKPEKKKARMNPLQYPRVKDRTGEETVFKIEE